MAKYTETLKEYLDNGNTLPNELNTITDFEDLFKERYAGSEIGFETETLFALRLDQRARVVMPLYKMKLDLLTAQYTELSNLAFKWRSEDRTYAYSKTTFDGTDTRLPFDAATAKPANASHSTTETDAKTDSFQYHESKTPAELLELLNEFNSRSKNLLDTCLDEFKSLFMEIY